ncbi:hypothetical protein AGMMS49521_0360 [Campylobacterota bacterium]|nr:hypothetical protein AGMMS49521_0360 [Campylobacterota bacterium]
MKKIALFLIFFQLLFCAEIVLKYGINDQELFATADKAAIELKLDGIHLGVIKKSEMLNGDGGLTALKLGYIELYALNAKDLQYVIKNIWQKLDSAKKGKSNELKSDLNALGFELIKLHFFNKKTVMILGNRAAIERLDTAKIARLKNLL